MKKRKGTRKIFIFLLIVIIIATIVVLGFIFIFKKADASYRIKKLGGEAIVARKASAYSKSALNLYNNGTFDIEIIYFDGTDYEKYFVGIGTYEKTKDAENKEAYRFIYIDCYTISGSVLVQNTNFIGTDNGIYIYTIVNKQIRFEFLGNIYYFGR